MSNVTDFGSTNVALALDVDFPSNVNQGPGIAIDKSAATWTVSLGYPPLLENFTSTPPNNFYLAVYDVAQNLYEKTRLDNLIAGATGLDTRKAIGDANYSATSADRYVGLSAPLTQNRLFTLPPAASVPGGRELVLQDEVGGLGPTHYFTIQPTGSDTIDGKGQRILSTPYGGLRFRSNGSNAWNVVAVSSVTPVANIGYACNSDDRTIVVTALTAPRTITLPLASGYPPGQRLTVADQSGQCGAVNTITVNPSGTDLVNGLAVNALAVINQAYGFLGLVSDGVSRWTIVDSASVTGSITSSQISDASPLGRQLLTQATAALDRTSLGSQPTGDAMFLAASPAAGRAVLGSGATGDAVFTSATPAAAQSAMGLGTMATQNANAVNITGGSVSGVALTPGSLANVTITSGTIDNTVIGATTPAAASVTSLNGGPLAGMRNRIINGTMDNDQRYNFASLAGIAGNTFVADRWKFVASQAGKFNAQTAVGGPVSFAHYLSFWVLSAYTLAASDNFQVIQIIEGLNTIDLMWGTVSAVPVTLSFWVLSAISGTHSGAISNGNATRSYPFTFSVPTAGVWTKIAITIPGDTTGTWAQDNTAGLILHFNLGTGSTFLGAAGAWSSNNYVGVTGSVQVVTSASGSFVFTGVQLEPGNVATPFERRLYGTELALCQRYYQRYTSPFASAFYYAGYQIAGWDIANTFAVPTMRAAPTATVIGTWTFNNCSLSITAASSSVNVRLTTVAANPATAASPANGGFDLNAEL